MNHPLTTHERLNALDAETHPPQILLAEYDLELQILVRDALSDEGYEVDTVDSGLDLITRIRDARSTDGYDLVLSGVRLSDCSGLDALELLREDDWATPALFMTAAGSSRTHREAQRLGAGVIDMPFDLEELVARIRELVPPKRYARGWRR